MKMSIGATSIIPPDEEDDLWSTGEPWHMQIDINNLENLVNNIESEISATARTKAKGVTPERLSKIWSIDIETTRLTSRSLVIQETYPIYVSLGGLKVLLS